MSDLGTSPRPAQAGTGADYRYADDDRGAGWVTFAGAMLGLVGTLNVIYGLAAIAGSRFYSREVTYILSDLNTWGWIITLIGAVQLVAMLAIFARAAFGRWVGVATAAVNAIAQLMFIPSYPFASLALFALDVLVIYALIVYGGRRSATA